MQFVYPSSQLLCAPNCRLISELQRDIFEEILVKEEVGCIFEKQHKDWFLSHLKFCQLTRKKKNLGKTSVFAR